MIRLTNINKSYFSKGKEYKVLDNIDMFFETDCFTIIKGPSGCGKSTILNILSGYDVNYQGSYKYYNIDVDKFNKKEMMKFANEHFGFVFQEYYLFDYLNVKDNILMGQRYTAQKSTKERFDEIVEITGLADLLNKYPSELSGGEKQRVAIARSLLVKKKILFADEPTGALDSKNTKIIMDIFKELNKNHTSIIMVTHDKSLLKYGKNVIEMDKLC